MTYGEAAPCARTAIRNCVAIPLHAYPPRALIRSAYSMMRSSGELFCARISTTTGFVCAVAARSFEREASLSAALFGLYSLKPLLALTASTPTIQASATPRERPLYSLRKVNQEKTNGKTTTPAISQADILRREGLNDC